MEQNNIGYGLFVPTWDFYGTMTLYDKENPDEESNFVRSDISILTVNAIDGSVIDLDKGY